jgi:hypothetical protein
MTDPKEHQEDREELDLDEETVRDLEPADEDADEVQGGRAAGTACGASLNPCP